MDRVGELPTARQLLFPVQASQEPLQLRDVRRVGAVLPGREADRLPVVGRVEHEGGDPARAHRLVGGVEVQTDEDVGVELVRPGRAIRERQLDVVGAGEHHPHGGGAALDHPRRALGDVEHQRRLGEAVELRAGLLAAVPRVEHHQGPVADVFRRGQHVDDGPQRIEQEEGAGVGALGQLGHDGDAVDRHAPYRADALRTLRRRRRDHVRDA